MSDLGRSGHLCGLYDEALQFHLDGGRDGGCNGVHDGDRGASMNDEGAHEDQHGHEGPRYQ
jgi:hypothetical protein